MKELLFIYLFLHIHNSFCLQVIVSGYNSKIATYNVDGNSLSPSTEWDKGLAGDSMTWLQMDGDHMWAGHEVGEYQGQPGSVVTRWRLSHDGASLERLGYVNTGSVYTAHILVDKDQGKVYAANYGGSSLSTMNLETDGSLGPSASVLTYEEEGCRDASHPHQTVTRGNWVWVVDLGCDKVRHYSLGADGHLESTGQTPTKAGAGPRHMVMHPSRDLMFLLCELQSSVLVYRQVPNYF